MCHYQVLISELSSCVTRLCSVCVFDIICHVHMSLFGQLLSYRTQALCTGLVYRNIHFAHK